MHPGLHAQTQPDQAAIIMPSRGVTITYRQLDEGSNRAAQLFRSLGLRQGDGIAMLLENHPRFYEIAWGAQRSGLYYTPMSTRLTPGEAEYIVGDCDAKVLITSMAMRETAEALRDRMPNVARRFMLDGTIDGFDAWEDAVATQPATPVADEIRGRRPALLVGHDRAAEGRQASPLRGEQAGQGEPPRHPHEGAVRLRTGHRVPVAGAALPRRAAALRLDGAAPRRRRCVIMEHFDAAECARR